MGSDSSSVCVQADPAADDGPWVNIPIDDDASTPADAGVPFKPVASSDEASAFFAQVAVEPGEWARQVMAGARAAGRQDLSLQDWLAGQTLPRREVTDEILMQVVRTLHSMVRGDQGQPVSSSLQACLASRTFEPLGHPIRSVDWSAADCERLCAELVARVDVPMRVLLLSLSTLADAPLQIADLADALRVELQYGLSRSQSVEVRASTVDALRVVLNGVREGGAHLLAAWASRAAVSAMVRQPAAMGLTALASVAATLGGVRHLRASASPQYGMQPIASLNALMGLAVVSGVVSVVAAGAVAVLDSATEMPAAQALMVVNLARALRQVVQTYSQSPATAGVTLLHQDGTPLNAQQQHRLNVLRDLLYVASSVALLGGASIPQVQQALAGLGAVTGLSAGLVAAGINEMLDGWNPELAKLLYACFSRDAVLVPGSQTAFWPDPSSGLNSWVDQTASRAVLAAPADILSALGMLLRHFSLSGVAVSVSFLGAAVAGGLGSMRGRVLSYLRSDQIIEENGSRNPAGLMSALGHLMRRTVRAVMPGRSTEPGWLTEARSHEQAYMLST